jgi:hypothetical protein
VKVDIPEEVKDSDYRDAATPEGVRELGHVGTPFVLSRAEAGLA